MYKLYRGDDENSGSIRNPESRNISRGIWKKSEDGQSLDIYDPDGFLLGKLRGHYEDYVEKDQEGNEVSRQRFLTEERINLFGSKEKTLQDLLDNPANHDAAEIMRGDLSQVNVKSLYAPKGNNVPDPLYEWFRKGIKDGTIDVHELKKKAELQREFLATAPKTNAALIKNIDTVMREMNWIYRDLNIPAEERFIEYDDGIGTDIPVDDQNRKLDDPGGFSGRNGVPEEFERTPIEPDASNGTDSGAQKAGSEEMRADNMADGSRAAEQETADQKRTRVLNMRRNEAAERQYRTSYDSLTQEQKDSVNKEVLLTGTRADIWQLHAFKPEEITKEVGEAVVSLYLEHNVKRNGQKIKEPFDGVKDGKITDKGLFDQMHELTRINPAIIQFYKPEKPSQFYDMVLAKDMPEILPYMKNNGLVFTKDGQLAKGFLDKFITEIEKEPTKKFRPLDFSVFSRKLEAMISEGGLRKEAAELLKAALAMRLVKELENPEKKEKLEKNTGIMEFLRGQEGKEKAMENAETSRAEELAAEIERKNSELMNTLAEIVHPETDKTKLPELAEKRDRLMKEIAEAEEELKNPGKKAEEVKKPEASVPAAPEAPAAETAPEAPVPSAPAHAAPAGQDKASQEQGDAPLAEKGVDETLSQEAKRIIEEEHMKLDAEKLRTMARESREKVADIAKDINGIKENLEKYVQEHPSAHDAVVEKFTKQITELEAVQMEQAKICVQRQHDLDKINEQLKDLKDSVAEKGLSEIKAANKEEFETAKGGMIQLRDEAKTYADRMQEWRRTREEITDIDGRRDAIVYDTPLRNAAQSFRSFFAEREHSIAKSIEGFANKLHQKYLGKAIGREFSRTGEVNMNAKITNFQQSKVSIITSIANVIESRALAHADAYEQQYSNVMAEISSIGGKLQTLPAEEDREYDDIVAAYKEKYAEREDKMNPIVEKALAKREEREKAAEAKEHNAPETPSPKKNVPSGDDQPEL